MAITGTEAAKDKTRSLIERTKYFIKVFLPKRQLDTRYCMNSLFNELKKFYGVNEETVSIIMIKSQDSNCLV